MPRPDGAPLFDPGAPVRVKTGIRDPDFPELDLGGWTATVLDVNEDTDPPNYELRWTEETRQRIDPVWRDRCENEGLDCDTIWLAETDLELDPSRMQELTIPRGPNHASPPRRSSNRRTASGSPWEYRPTARFPW